MIPVEEVVLFDFLFGRKKPGRASGADSSRRSGAPAVMAPSTVLASALQHNPKLVTELKADHQSLLKTLDRIEQALADGDLARSASLLEAFGAMATAHLLKEDFRFYVYLEQALAYDPATHAQVFKFRLEMEGIGKDVLAFLAKYRNLAITPDLSDSFAAELADMGKVLRERIEREERTLYPMYLPAY